MSEADERERIAESPVFCEAKNGPNYYKTGFGVQFNFYKMFFSESLNPVLF